jgi:hypothetical protein
MSVLKEKNHGHVRLMVFDVFFNNILVISWHSVLLMEETEVSGENHRPAASHRHILLHIVVSSAPRHLPDSN